MTEVVRFTSGLSHLVGGVREYFEATMGDDAPIVKFGYLERPKQGQGPGGANRVVFLPADPKGNAGKITPPRDVGRSPVLDEDDVPVAEIRPLASWERMLTISVWAHDAAAPRDELAQFAAAEALFEKTLQAVEQVRGAGGPNVAWGGVACTPTKENTLGAELLIGFQLIHPLMDAPAEYATPGFSLKRVGIDEEEDD